MKKNNLSKITLQVLNAEQSAREDRDVPALHLPHEADWFAHFSTLRLPSLCVDQMATFAELREAPADRVQCTSDKQDVPDIGEQATWILPVIAPDYVSQIIATPAQTVVAVPEKQASLLLKIVKSSGIYALASVAQPLVTLGLAPFLTHHLSPGDYGAFTLLNNFISLTAGVTQLGLGSAFFRAYSYDYTSERDRRDVLATVSTLLALVSIIVVLAVLLVAPFLASLLFGQASFSNLIILSAGVIAAQNLAVPVFSWLRAENRPLFYSLLAISNLLISLVANLVLVGVCSLGIVGSLIASGGGYACVVLCTIPLVLLRSGIKLRPDIARGVLTFGLPLVLNVISYWVLQVLDRYLLSIFGSLAQTAEYAVAYSLGSALSIVVIAPFGLAWPTVLFGIAKRRDAPQVFKRLFRWFSLFLLFAAYGLSLAGTILLNWLFPVEYHAAAAIIPVVSASLVFYGVYNIFLTGINVKRKTWLISIYSTIAATVNFSLNLFLIPHFEAMGAAIATLLAYMVLALVAYVVNQRIYPIPFEIGKSTLALLLGAALYVGSNFLAQVQPTYGAWSISFGALGIYGICLGGYALLPTWLQKRASRYKQEVV